VFFCLHKIPKKIMTNYDKIRETLI